MRAGRIAIEPESGAGVADAAASETGKGRSGLIPLILTVAVLTVVAAAGGGFMGHLIGASGTPEEPVAAAETADAASAGEEDAAESEASGEAAAAVEEAAGDVSVVPLQPVYTNLYAPNDVWLRVEASLVVSESDEDGEAVDTEQLAAEVEADTLAFLRSAQLSQIEGTRGLLHLTDDLRTRARMRSTAVKDYLVRALVAE